jgi:hypothetical protein
MPKVCPSLAPNRDGVVRSGSQPQMAQLLISHIGAGSAELLVHNTPDRMLRVL